jgi:hypothetical protein
MKRGAWDRVGLIAVLVGVLLLARFTIPTLIATVRDAISSRLSAAVERRLRRPPPVLPIRPADYVRFPRRGFGFDWSTASGWRVDTFHGTVTEDRMADPDTTIALVLTPTEMDSIYQRVIEIRLFDLPKPRQPAQGPQWDPNSRDEWRFLARAGLAEQDLVWHTNERLPDDDSKRVIGLMKMIQRIVQRRPEYRALPPPRGHYL